MTWWQWSVRGLGRLRRISRGGARLRCACAGVCGESEYAEADWVETRVQSKKWNKEFRPDQGLEFVNVGVTFGTRSVLELSVGPLTERRVAVIGCNGSGKSILLRLLNGLVDCSYGDVYVDGANVKTNKSEVRQYVGFVFQDPDAQIVMPTVEEEMQLGLKALRLGPEEMDRHAVEALERFGLKGRGRDSPHLLSGGEKAAPRSCLYLCYGAEHLGDGRTVHYA